jgi:hypothetical protein
LVSIQGHAADEPLEEIAMRMRPLSIVGGAASAVLLCLGAAGLARAQDESNPPGRVAQLSYAEGSVSLEPAGTSTWTSADRNRPLTLGDRLWADQDSRAELDIGDAVIRIGSMTGFSFLNLDDETAQMQVTAGTVIVHVRSLSSGEEDEIDTPNLALTLQQPGTYRVQVSDSGDATRVEVEEGEALATGGGQSFPVAAQQSVTFTGASVLTADYATLGAPDAFDDWSMQRDQEEAQQAAVAQQYIPPAMVGGTDLGSYGTWQQTPDWGYAWFPAVAAGWAPYTLGQWVWVSPWGWTWVDEEPWGFAPFHYGRWGYWHRRWCWVPGPRHTRPIYAPALVAWVGGRHGGVALSAGGHVGWFPLGPRDVYVPGYRASPGYVRNINVTNVRVVNTTYITNVYEGRAGNVRYGNSEVPGAVTAVPRNVFTSAQPVAPHRVVLPHQGGLQFRATTAAPAIMPLRQSVLGARAGRVIRAPPRAVMDRPVVARLAPPRAPVSFAREQAAIRANGGRPVPMAELARLRPNTPAAPVRLAPARGARPGLELRTAPGNRVAPNGFSMSQRERILQEPTLPPARAPANDRPSWAQRRTTQFGGPASRPNPEAVTPQQSRAPLEWRVPPQRQAAPLREAPAPRFVPAPRQKPEPQFTPPERQAPVQRFSVPERQAPAQRFAPPERQAPVQRFAPPERQAPTQRFAPSESQAPTQRFAPPESQAPTQRFAPPERQIQEPRFTPPPRATPQQRFTPQPTFHPPREMARPPMPPRAAPAPSRPPEGRPMERAPPPAHPRADAASFSFRTGYAEQWQSPPPMYRPREGATRFATPPRAIPTGAPYRPPAGPPPMYRPLPPGRAAAAPVSLGSRRLALVRARRIG